MRPSASISPSARPQSFLRWRLHLEGSCEPQMPPGCPSFFICTDSPTNILWAESQAQCCCLPAPLPLTTSVSCVFPQRHVAPSYILCTQFPYLLIDQCPSPQVPNVSSTCYVLLIRFLPWTVPAWNPCSTVMGWQMGIPSTQRVDVKAFVSCPYGCLWGPAQEGRRTLSAAAAPPSRMDTAEVTLDMSRRTRGPVWQARAAVLEDGTVWAMGSDLPGSLHTPGWVRAPWGWQTHWADLFYATMFVVGSPAWYLGHLPEVRHRLWDSAASQRVSFCRCLKPQPRPAPQRSAEKGNMGLGH